MDRPELKFNPVSVDKLGTYRWFQSKHPIVNEMIEDFLQVGQICMSKKAWFDLVEKLELRFKLSRTQRIGNGRK